MADPLPHLKNLNAVQRLAVTHDPTIPLQILAGPGSGKTRTLTCRIAHLIRKHDIQPSNIVAVTFTNKAALELRVRLEALIGREAASLLVLGTFHAICGRLLRQHGNAINLPRNFSICDSDSSKKMIKEILKNIVDSSGAHAAQNGKFDLQENLAAELISKAKAKGLSPEDIKIKAEKDMEKREPLPKGEFSPDVWLKVSRVYAKYAAECKKNNMLDFDDLLVCGVKLLKARPTCVDCYHIFVDEFQDTNTTQFELMCLFAQIHRNVSIVGDPDQSIYGWRSAEIENLDRMIKRFPTTEQIFLEDNYRSTKAILTASIAIISEDTNRPPKTLRTSHPQGTIPTLGNCADEHEEASCIAKEIKRLKLISGGMLKWNDFAILLRFNSLSRVIETALQKEGIPSKVLAGQKFFDRVEVKDLLAYLQVVDNPSFDPAVLRIINIPKRSIGSKSLEEIRQRAVKLGQPIMHVVDKIVDGRIPDIDPPLRDKAKPLVRSLRKIRSLATKGRDVPDLIRELLTELEYAEHLKKAYPDWESRWENVQELITFATEAPSPTEIAQEFGVAVESKASIEATIATISAPLREVAGVIDLTEDDDEDEQPTAVTTLDNEEAGAGEDSSTTNRLRSFLESTSLSTDVTVNDDSSDSEKVVISTVHAAKGLEWPVVFVPSVEHGTYPSYRSENLEECRRLLYVACTRAQVLLYLTNAAKRKFGGDTKNLQLSDFLKTVIDKDKKKTLFTSMIPTIHNKEISDMCKVLEREVPDTKVVEEAIRQYYKPEISSQQAPIETPSLSQEQKSKKSFQFKPVDKPASTGLQQKPSQPTAQHPAVFSTARAVINSLPPVRTTPPVKQPVSRSMTARQSTSRATTGKATAAKTITGKTARAAPIGLREISTNTNTIIPNPAYYRPHTFQQTTTPTPASTTVSKTATTLLPGVAPGTYLNHQVTVPPDYTLVPMMSVPGSSSGQTTQMPQPAATFTTALSAHVLSSQSSASPFPPPASPPPQVAGTKRRLGMSSAPRKR